MTAEPPAPLLPDQTVAIAEGVYVAPDPGVPLVPNVGIVVGSRGALVVDTGMGLRNGSMVRRHADALAEGKPLTLTLTHFHPEHGYGAQAFEDGATILYNRGQLEELRQKGPQYLEMFKTFGESVAHELKGVTLVEADITYDTRADLMLGGTTAQLRTWGQAHTLADQIVFLVEQRILFTGDLVENRCFPIFPWMPPDDADVDGDRWIAVLEELERLRPAIVVPGHGEVGGADIITSVLDYLQQLRGDTRQLAADGASEEEAAAELDRAMRGRHPDWTQPEWIASGARCFYAAYERELERKS